MHRRYTMKINTAVKILNNYGGGKIILSIIYNVTADILCKQLNIQKPELYFYENNVTGGQYSPKNKWVALNVKSADALLEADNLMDCNYGFLRTVDLVAHELRHAWQDNNNMIDINNYTSIEKDYKKYMNDPIEVDAREYACKVSRQIVGEVMSMFANFADIAWEEMNL